MLDKDIIIACVVLLYMNRAHLCLRLLQNKDVFLEMSHAVLSGQEQIRASLEVKLDIDARAQIRCPRAFHLTNRPAKVRWDEVLHHLKTRDARAGKSFC